MGSSSRIHYRLVRPTDALGVGKLARWVTRRWILPELLSSAAPLLLADTDARVIRGKIAAGNAFIWPAGRTAGWSTSPR